MNKPYIRLAVFLVLMLVMSVGLTYSSLNQVDQASVNKNEQEDNSMSIALVNEDDGAIFNQNKLDFGDAFAGSIGQNNVHEWYIVSRGVAEGGLERKVYDMMIVIPNDFSNKALSINSESPEQVVLSYKINASDSEAVQAQAEETVSTILNKFNREIIDVYFASVLGNLQEAQDNVAKIVEDDAELTHTYNNAIYAPLSDYTNQFGAVQANTERSREGFSSFEDTLNSYNERLKDRMGFAEDYQTNIAETVELAKTHSVPGLDFLEQLNVFNDTLNSGDVKAQLEQLQSMNEYINARFTINEGNNEMKNVEISTEKLKSRLNTALKTVEDVQSKYNIEELKETIKKDLSTTISNAFDENFHDEKSLTEILSIQEERIQGKIEERISRLPSMSKELIGNTDLSSEMIKEIQNVIDVTHKYNNEFGQVAYRVNDKPILPDINALKEHLKKNGMLIKDTVELPEAEKPHGTFKVYDIPEGFTINYLSIQMDDGDPIYYENYQENTGVPLPSYQKGQFTVTVNLKLKDNAENIDIYESKEWKWELNLKEEKTSDQSSSDGYALIEMPTATLTASTTVDKTENKDDSHQKTNENSTNKLRENSAEKDLSDESNKQEGDESSKSDAGSEQNNKTGENQNPGQSNDEETGKVENPNKVDEPKKDSGETGENNDSDEDEEKEIKKVEIEHHYIRHEVTNPVIDESTQDLMNAVENTISPYQKLLSLYEAYFGFSLTCENINESSECVTFNNDSSLKGMARNDSLYALFNKDLGELLAYHISSQVTEDATQKITEPLNLLEKQIDSYRNFIAETNQNAEKLVSTIQGTTESATVLNKNLQQTLNDITNWRKQSLNLLESETVIRENNKEETKAVMTLGDEFKPILSQSQTLAKRASGNLNKADNVYQTFERIDEQAESIQESGRTVIKRAEVLSTNMTDQLLEDQEFVENFSQVMANSQIGGRQNEELYDFLSSPVDAKNKGLTIEGNTFTPYFLVLICFIVALFTAYVISTAKQQHTRDNQFETEQSLMRKNSLITGITVGLGVLEGLVIGLVSAYLLGTEIKLILWASLMILIMLTMVLVFTYLLRQLKMIGMFILLIVMSMYLFLTDALTSSLSGMEALRDYSPLHYADTLLTNAMQGGSDYLFIVLSMIGMVLLAAFGNLLVIARKGKKATEGDDNAA